MSAADRLTRRRFIQAVAASAPVALQACGAEPEPGRYTAEDIELLSQQRSDEAARSGRGPYGRQVYRGYRGLAELPWFELNDDGVLHCVDDSVPRAVDVHAHFGISVFLAPEVDLHATPPRVRHLLDCDATDPGCDLDLDIYINGNFDAAALKALQRSTLAQGLWGSGFAKTQTLPALLAEMDSMRVQHAFVLPIKTGLPWGDDLTERWYAAIEQAGAHARLSAGLSVHPLDADCIAQMQAHAAAGMRMMKLHPTVQQFYPDDPVLMPLYEEAQRLGLVIFFHGGRAGIEPESRHRYAMPRHYEAALANFPQLQFVLGHAGARDNEAMLQLAMRYDNAWLGIHGQGVSRLEEMIQRTGGERLLFGSDWPFYHLAPSLAKVLLCTRGPQRQGIRRQILRENALRLFPELAAV